MRKSLIEINRPETKRFGDYRQLADHLNEVKDSSEWTIVRAEDTSFDGESGANTFEAMGGDEFSCVSVSFDEGVTQIPLRYTALTSILNRCEVSGDGIKKLFVGYLELPSSEDENYKANTRKGVDVEYIPTVKSALVPF